MFSTKWSFAPVLTLSLLGACGNPDTAAEKDTEIEDVTSALPHNACVNEFYSDATYSALVGEWSCTCNGCYQWGTKTAFKIHWCEDCGRPNPNLS